LNPILIKTVVAGGTVPQWAIVKPDTTAGQYVAAAAATDKLIGVNMQPGGCVSGDRMDVCFGGLVDTTAGGTIAAGDLLTSDASGNAVTAAPAAGVNNRIIGVAFEAAVSGDIFRVIVAPASTQG
jgi:hypothetical protein